MNTGSAPDPEYGVTALEPVSLLWPAGSRPAQHDPLRLSSEAMADLDAEELIAVLADGDQRQARFVHAVFATLCSDPLVIEARAAVVANLLEDTALRARLQGVLPALTALAQGGISFPDEWVVDQVIRRLNELSLYSEAMVQLHQALDIGPLHAPGLRSLHAHLEATVQSAAFIALQAELPALRAALSRIGSITVGINLSDDLQPESAAILSIDAEKVTGRAVLLDRLFGGRASLHAMTPLRLTHPTPFGPETQLARDIRALLERVTAPVRSALDRYLSVNTRTLRALEPELAFLLQGVALIERMHAVGLPLCRPACLPMDQRACTLTESYNISLALRMLRTGTGSVATLVRNPMTFEAADARVWILTGPNRGGKTIYTRSVGLVHLLFQAGLYVPARCARISPVDAIHTHFPTPEGAQPGMGRLDEEAARLARIFQLASPHSLILLNEVLSGTSAAEALDLATDVVRGLRLLGARAIYVTHLHELTERITEINACTRGDGTVGSLVAEVAIEGIDGVTRRTFRIQPGMPGGSSHASAIAEQHGISFPQLAALLHKRGILSRADTGSTGESQAV